MDQKAHRIILHTYIGHLNVEDLEAIVKAKKAVAHANAQLGLSAQCEANRESCAATRKAIENLSDYYLGAIAKTVVPAAASGMLAALETAQRGLAEAMQPHLAPGLRNEYEVVKAAIAKAKGE